VERWLAEKIRTFRDLKVWQKAKNLFIMSTIDIEHFPKRKPAQVIAMQLLRCMGSISANIAEGFGRKSQGEFGYHLGVAKGSATESQDWYIKCDEIEYLPEEIVNERMRDLEEVIRMLNSLISKIGKES